MDQESFSYTLTPSEKDFQISRDGSQSQDVCKYSVDNNDLKNIDYDAPQSALSDDQKLSQSQNINNVDLSVVKKENISDENFETCVSQNTTQESNNDLDDDSTEFEEEESEEESEGEEETCLLSLEIEMKYKSASSKERNISKLIKLIDTKNKDKDLFKYAELHKALLSTEINEDNIRIKKSKTSVIRKIKNSDDNPSSRSNCGKPVVKERKSVNVKKLNDDEPMETDENSMPENIVPNIMNVKKNFPELLTQMHKNNKHKDRTILNNNISSLNVNDKKTNKENFTVNNFKKQHRPASINCFHSAIAGPSNSREIKSNNSKENLNVKTQNDLKSKKNCEDSDDEFQNVPDRKKQKKDVPSSSEIKDDDDDDDDSSEE